MKTLEQKAQNVKAFESVLKVAAISGDPIAPLTAWYELGPVEPTGGYWYFCGVCQACGRQTPMFRDYSDGHLGKPFSMFGFRLVCHFCQANVVCAAEAAFSVEWPLEPGQARPVTEYAVRPPLKHKSDPEYRPVGRLHHYTSLDSLVSIVQSRSLRATNVYYLNDSSESELGLSLIRDVGVEARRTAQGVDASFLEFVLQWLEGNVFEFASVYVVCFSEIQNQLSQWRGYTPHGRGVCLSIDAAVLIRRMQSLGWTFQACRYGRESQLAWAEAILNRMRTQAMVNGSADEAQLRGIVQSNLSDLLQVAATIKNDAFVEEHEIRFISPMIDLGDERVSYRVGRTALIPYVEFGLAERTGEPLDIQEIVVGPSTTEHLTRSSVLGLIKQRRISESCEVKLSRIPYREL